MSLNPRLEASLSRTQGPDKVLIINTSRGTRRNINSHFVRITDNKNSSTNLEEVNTNLKIKIGGLSQAQAVSINKETTMTTVAGTSQKISVQNNHRVVNPSLTRGRVAENTSTGANAPPVGGRLALF